MMVFTYEWSAESKPAIAVSPIQQCLCKTCQGEGKPPKKHPYTDQERELVSIILQHPLGIQSDKKSDNKFPLMDIIFAYGIIEESWLDMHEMEGILSMVPFLSSRIKKQPVVPYIIQWTFDPNTSLLSDGMKKPLIDKRIECASHDIEKLSRFIDADYSEPSVRGVDTQAAREVEDKANTCEVMSSCGNYKIIARRQDVDITHIDRKIRVDWNARILALLKQYVGSQ